MNVPPAEAKAATPATPVKPETTPVTAQATAPTAAPAADDLPKALAAPTTDTTKVAAPTSITPTKPAAVSVSAAVVPPVGQTDTESLAVVDATDRLGSLILGRGIDEPVPEAVKVEAADKTANSADTQVPAPQTAAKVDPQPQPAAKTAEAVTPPPNLAGGATATATGPVPHHAPPADVVAALPAFKRTPEDTPKVAEAAAVAPATTTADAVVIGASEPAAPTTVATATEKVVARAAPEGQPKITATHAVTETPAAAETAHVTEAKPKVKETTPIAKDAPVTEQAAVNEVAPSAPSTGTPVTTAGGAGAATGTAATGTAATGAAVVGAVAAASVTEKTKPTTDAATAVPAVAEEKETEPDAAATEATAATPVPAPDVTVENWGTLPASHPLLAFHAQLGDLIKFAGGHSKIWGITLDPTTPTFSTLLVLQKYLRSTDGLLRTATNALGITLKWRREFGLDGPTPIWDEPHGDEFDGLGYLTHLRHGDDMEVVTWNMYCDVHDLKHTFGDVDKFVRWRVGLMERAMAHLDLAHTTVPIPDYGKGDDPHRMVQVHVYTGMAFLRMDPHVKAAARDVIRILAPHYPETLSRKLFVGVPRVMNWVYSALTFFVSAATAKKFSPISAEKDTAAALGDPAHVPKRFGGTGPDLADLDRAAAIEAKSIEHPAAAAPAV